MAKRVRKSDLLERVGKLLSDIGALGYQPVLVGGMALVTLGSTRVTRDFDFVIDTTAREHLELIKVFYRHDLHLVAGLDGNGNVTDTIDNATVAAARLKIDQPLSAYFYDRNSGLKVDLLFDYPIPVQEIRGPAVEKKIRSFKFLIASKEDLIRMKEIAAADRGQVTDLSDLAFLKGDSSEEQNGTS